MINDTAYFKVGNMPYGGVETERLRPGGGKVHDQEMTEEKVVVLNLC